MALTAQEIEQSIKEWVPMAKDIGFKVEEVREGFGRVRIPFQSKHIRPGGTISGPVMMTAADTAMYVAILGSLGGMAMAVTSNLNINFLKRPEQRDLIADASIIKLGKRIAFCEVAIRCEGADELVAHVTGSYSLPPSETIGVK
ncbi:MAG: PaaI family thioesterase [Methylotenera sp.]